MNSTEQCRQIANFSSDYGYTINLSMLSMLHSLRYSSFHITGSNEFRIAEKLSLNDN